MKQLPLAYSFPMGLFVFLAIFLGGCFLRKAVIIYFVDWCMRFPPSQPYTEPQIDLPVLPYISFLFGLVAGGLLIYKLSKTAIRQ